MSLENDIKAALPDVGPDTPSESEPTLKLLRQVLLDMLESNMPAIPEWVTVDDDITLDSSHSGKALWVTEDATITLPAYESFAVEIVVAYGKDVSVECDGTDTFQDGTTASYAIGSSASVASSPDADVWAIVGNYS